MNTTDTPETIAATLRDAAAWLRLAATKLDEGDLEGARNMARLGLYGCERMPDRIAALVGPFGSWSVDPEPTPEVS